MRVDPRAFRHALAVSVVAGGSSVACACSSAGGQSSDVSASQAGTKQAGPGGAGGALAAAGGVTSSGGGGTSKVGGGSGGSPPIVAAGGFEGSSGGSSSALAGNAGSGASSFAGAAGSNGTDPACPRSLTGGLVVQRTCERPGMTCGVSVDCNSGRRVLTMTCDGGQWKGPTGCDTPYDFCLDATGGTGGLESGIDCVEGKWSIETGTSDFPPTPCPAEPPSDGMPCDAVGGTESNGDRKHCGYPCHDSAKWTVLSCAASGASGTWRSDRACD